MCLMYIKAKADYSMTKVVPFRAPRGRPEARIPDKISPRRIASAAALVNPDSTDKKRIILEVDGWLKDLIEKSAPEGTSTKTVLLFALAEAGYPITLETLNEIRGDDE